MWIKIQLFCMKNKGIYLSLSQQSRACQAQSCLRTLNKQLYSPQSLVTARQILLPKISDSTITATSVLGNKASFSPGTAAVIVKPGFCWGERKEPLLPRARNRQHILAEMKTNPNKTDTVLQAERLEVNFEAVHSTGCETVTGIRILGWH